MSFDWAGYLKVADNLVVQNRRSACNEAMVRAAVSRAYYAVYHSAHAELTARGKLKVSGESDGVHKIVENALFSVRDPAWKTAGNVFRRYALHG